MIKIILPHIVCLFIFLGPKQVTAQYNLDQTSQIIRVEDGLPNHYLRGIVQDSYGFIWVGSYDGLSRYDGKQIKVFRHIGGDSTSIIQNSVISIGADPNNGEVWIGTFGGLSVYQPAAGRFRTYLQDDQDSTSLQSNYVSWVYVDRQSEVWVGSRSNILSRLNPDKDGFVKYRPSGISEDNSETIQTIEQDLAKDDLIWLGSQERLFSFDKQSQTFNYDYPAISGIRQIHAHEDGYLYIRDEESYITIYNPENHKIVDKVRPQEGWHLGRLYRKSGDELWANANKGVAIFNTQSFDFSYPWVNDSIQKKNYRISLIDKEKRIWAATASGLKLYDPQTTQFSNYLYQTTGPSAPYITQRLLEDPERDWIVLNVSAGNGVYILNRKTNTWRHIPPPKDYREKRFHGSGMALLENGQLLILDTKGVFTLTPDGKSMERHPLMQKLPAEKRWVNLFLDTKGYLWLGGEENGILKIDTKTWEVESTDILFKTCEKQPYFRWTFFEDNRDHLWFTVCDGIAFYSYQTNSFHYLLHEDNPANTVRTPKDFVLDQEDILWVSDEEANQLGAINVNEPQKGIIKKYSFSQSNTSGSIQIVKGMANSVLGVSRLAVDPANNLWTFGPSGVMKIHPDRQTVELYDELDGLQWLDEKLKVPSVNQIESLSTGEIMVGYRKGVSIFDPTTLTISQEVPVPYLTNFSVYNNPWPADSSIFATRTIDLNYWENYFSFEFSSIGYTNSDHHQYQYKLDGVDKDWVYSGQRSYASYTNVEGGHYTFRVKVANRDGIWNDEPLKVDVFVATPWWRAMWFKLSMVLLFGTGIYSFYRYRLRQVRKAERVKAEFENKLAGVELSALRSQMNPHFLFNCLNSIESYIIKNESKKASEYLNNFSRLIRLILQNSRSNYVTISDEVEALKLYMEMENLRLRQSFNHQVTIDDQLDPDSMVIPPMLLQPYVENAIWHGLMYKKERGTITVNLKKEADHLLCTIEDDGVGRKKSAEFKSRRPKKKSMGMSITQERIEIFNKAYNTNTSVRVIDLESSKGEAKGTRVELKIMLEKD